MVWGGNILSRSMIDGCRCELFVLWGQFNQPAQCLSRTVILPSAQSTKAAVNLEGCYFAEIQECLRWYENFSVTIRLGEYREILWLFFLLPMPTGLAWARE
jgi:hypothetical protein